jgi:hypothetical protein
MAQETSRPELATASDHANQTDRLRRSLAQSEIGAPAYSAILGALETRDFGYCAKSVLLAESLSGSRITSVCA